MKKIILRIDDNIDDEKALRMALVVVEMGKISKTDGKDQYCFHSTFKDDTAVSVLKQPTGTETFYIR
jgi:hypothetical protein